MSTVVLWPPSWRWRLHTFLWNVITTYKTTQRLNLDDRDRRLKMNFPTGTKRVWRYGIQYANSLIPALILAQRFIPDRLRGTCWRMKLTTHFRKELSVRSSTVWFPLILFFTGANFLSKSMFVYTFYTRKIDHYFTKFTLFTIGHCTS
jgi:hypothetical protein